MKLKRIIAIISVIFLLLLYITTIVLAFIESNFAYQLLQLSIFCTVVIPSIMYAFILAMKWSKNKAES